MESPPLRSLSLTHVSYNPHDPWAWISAHLALVPQALIISYVTLLWATREVEVLLMFAGQMSCEGLNFILKRYFREARPTDHVGTGYGMPSSHAQYAAYFSIYLALFLLFRHDPVNHPDASSTPFWRRLALAASSVFCAAAVAYSRIYLNYHTRGQVIAGCAAGAAYALGWFLATTVARRVGLVDWFLDIPLVKWLRMRDLVVSESFEDAGWERYQQTSRRRTVDGARKRK